MESLGIISALNLKGGRRREGMGKKEMNERKVENGTRTQATHSTFRSQ